ncbi:MAG: hypothetical protein MAG453_01951 [Calditrichaeota bacterium]|nr:hypothetical protein [Calditrichota bacterium]
MMRRLPVLLCAMFVAAAFSFAQTPIHDIQFVDDPASDDASPMAGETVTVQGYITFEPMSEGNGFFIADAPGAWNGIYVYTGGGENYGFGWEVSVTGEVSEYNGLTEIAAENVELIDDQGDAVDFWSEYDPLDYYTVVDASMLSEAATAEQYEGVLVRVEDVTVSELPGDFGEWDVEDAGGNGVAIDDPATDDFGYYHKVLEGQSYVHIQGALNYSFGEYKIRPEIAYDLKVEEDPDNGYYTQIAYFQQVRPMDMTIREDVNGDLYTWDSSYAARVRYGLEQDPEYGEEVTIRAVVTYPTELGYAGEGAKFIMSDHLVGDTAEPWMSVLSYNPDPETYGNLFEGDEIVFYGEVGEYSRGPGHMTELWITDPFDNVDFGIDMPAPAVIDVPELRQPQYAERWGNVFVELQNVIVTNLEPTPYELFTIDDDLEDEWLDVKVDDDSDAMSDYQDPPLGTNIESISGWIYHHFGTLDVNDANDWTYKICPAYPEDIVIGEGPPNILSVTRDYGAPGPYQPVVIGASVSDNNEVASVTLHYRVDEGEWNDVEMEHQGGIEYEGEIEGQPEGSFVEYYVEAVDDLEQSSTAPSDLDEQYYGYEATDNMTINVVQYTPWNNGVSPYNGYSVEVTGVVTNTLDNANYYADEDYGPAFFIQTGDTAPWSGVVVHLTPAVGTLPEYGDEVTVEGTVDDTGLGWSFKWGGNTRILDVFEMTNNGSGNDYSVYDATAAEVNAALEQYESVAVRFSELTITGVNEFDWSFTDGSGEEFLLDDDLIPDTDTETLEIFESLAAGTTISDLTGIVTYSFGTWKVEVRFADDFGTVGVDENFVAQPHEFALDPVYPNPFNPTATVSFSLPRAADVKLIVYNAMGRKVRKLIDAPMQAGRHSGVWNGRDDSGREVASGAYFLRLIAGDRQQVRKMVLMK